VKLAALLPTTWGLAVLNWNRAETMGLLMRPGWKLIALMVMSGPGLTMLAGMVFEVRPSW